MGASMQLISLWYLVAKFLRWSGIKTTKAFRSFRELSCIMREENKNPRAGISVWRREPTARLRESPRHSSHLSSAALNMETTWRAEENLWLSETFSGSQSLQEHRETRHVIGPLWEEPGACTGALVWAAPILHRLLWDRRAAEAVPRPTEWQHGLRLSRSHACRPLDSCPPQLLALQWHQLMGILLWPGSNQKYKQGGNDAHH